jgi:hypothetical protein
VTGETVADGNGAVETAADAGGVVLGADVRTAGPTEDTVDGGKA